MRHKGQSLARQCRAVFFRELIEEGEDHVIQGVAQIGGQLSGFIFDPLLAFPLFGFASVVLPDLRPSHRDEAFLCVGSIDPEFWEPGVFLGQNDLPKPILFGVPWVGALHS